MKFFLSLLIGCHSLMLFSQTCTGPRALHTLEGNGLKAVICTAADFGWDLNDSKYQPAFQAGGVNPSTIFMGTIWYGGLDSSGFIRMGAGEYRNPGSSLSPFYTGPLNAATASTTPNNCANWDILFRVSASEIDAFFDDLSDGNLSANHFPILRWPGRGNPHFLSLMGFNLPDQDLAPFHDANNDGIYNPMEGDYPVVKLQGLDAFVPDQQMWTIVNDEGAGAGDNPDLPVELHITYFVFNCPEKPLIHNAMFTSHKFINRTDITLDSFCIAQFIDFDLGCYKDDYVGCNPATNTFYAYNRTNVDIASSSCDGVSSFRTNPPVQAVTFLNRSLDVFMPIQVLSTNVPLPETSDPSVPIEYFRYLHGFWRDGTPLTSGGSGYDPSLSSPVTTHAFPGNPNIGTEWSMLSASIPQYDQRGLGVHNAGTFSPGQILELNAAFTYHRGPGLSYLENVDLMLQEVPHLSVLYANNFSEVCVSSVSTNETFSQPEVSIWPNPASNELHVDIKDLGLKTIHVFDISGRLMNSGVYEGSDSLTFNIETWPSGTYFLRINTQSGTVVKKVVVI